MSLMIKFFCILLVLGVAGLFIVKKPDGSPWLSVNDFIPENIASTDSIRQLMNNALDTLKKTTSSLSNNEYGISDDHEGNSEGNHHIEKASTEKLDNGSIHRWKDSKGQWQYSDKKPLNQITETVNITGNLNQDLYEQRTLDVRQEVNSPQEKNSDASQLPNRAASISPEKISTLIKDAKNIQKLVDDRQRKLEQSQ